MKVRMKMEPVSKKQGVVGFKVVSYQVKRVKEYERFRGVIEGDIEDILCGEYDMGDFQKALLNHRISDTDVGFSVFVS